MAEKLGISAEELRAEWAIEAEQERLYEMRAAFGEGETVVNIFTGKQTRL